MKIDMIFSVFFLILVFVPCLDSFGGGGGLDVWPILDVQGQEVAITVFLAVMHVEARRFA